MTFVNPGTSTSTLNRLRSVEILDDFLRSLSPDYWLDARENFDCRFSNVFLNLISSIYFDISAFTLSVFALKF